jgi:hypothetical protein
MTEYISLYVSFPPKSYPLKTSFRCQILHYDPQTTTIFLSDIHLQDRDYPGIYAYKIGRTNGELLSTIYHTAELGLTALNNVPARLLNLKYISIGYNGRMFENQSWLFQPLDGIITKGMDWYVYPPI